MPLTERPIVKRSVLELLVIIAGVLIALAVNDWSSTRNERKLESEYLRRLQEELRQDSTLTYHNLLPRLAQKRALLDTIRQTVNGRRPVGDTLAFMKLISQSGALGFAGGYTSRATFDEMNSSGSLRLIHDPELRARIVAVYNDASVQELRIAARFSGYAPFNNGFMPGALNERVTMADLRDFGLKQAFATLHSDEFRRRLNMETNFAIFLNRNLRVMAVKRDSLLTDINAELAQPK